MSNRNRPISGWINLNKPIGMSSATAVATVKRITGAAKIGHAGTLDPLATGVLPLALGEATKCVNLLMDAKKTYRFEVAFGECRTTDDAEGEVTETSSVIPAETQIREVLPQFTGEIMQLPPDYSALKVEGRRAYAMARAGEKPILQPRPVTIYKLELQSFTGPDRASFEATVSKGTYIRVLGREIAAAAGSRGYISKLHRATVGKFSDNDAILLDFLHEAVHKAAPPEGMSRWLRPIRAALDDIPAYALEAGQLKCLRHGQPVLLAAPLPESPLMAALFEDEVVALTRCEGHQLVPIRLLNSNPDVA